MSGWYCLLLLFTRFAEDKPSVGDEVTQVLPFQVEEEEKKTEVIFKEEYDEPNEGDLALDDYNPDTDDLWEGPLDGDYDFDEQAIDRKLHNRKPKIQIPEEAQHPELQDRKESETKEEKLVPAVITRTPNRPEKKAPHSPPSGPKPPPGVPRGPPGGPRGPSRPQVGRGRPAGRSRPIPGQSRPQPSPQPQFQPQPQIQEYKATEPSPPPPQPSPPTQPSYIHNAAPQPHLEQVIQQPITYQQQPEPVKPKLQIQSQPVIESTYEEKKDDSLLYPQPPPTQPPSQLQQQQQEQQMLYQVPIQQQQVVIQNPAPKIIHHVQEVIFGEISIPPVEKKPMQQQPQQQQPPPVQQTQPRQLQPQPQPQQPPPPQKQKHQTIIQQPQKPQQEEPPPPQPSSFFDSKDMNESGVVDGEPLISPFDPSIHMSESKQDGKDSEMKETHISPPPPMMKQQMKFTNYNTPKGPELLMTFPGTIQCTLTRMKKNILMSVTEYQLAMSLENGDEQLLMVALRQACRTPNYHIFDMTNCNISDHTKLSKKDGNYLGKLRCNFTGSESVIYGNSLLDIEDKFKPEFGAGRFIKPPARKTDNRSAQPRKIDILLPAVSSDRRVIPHKPTREADTLLSRVTDLQHIPEGYYLLHNKAPVFTQGSYRLNFNGRVNVSSVKNFQLVMQNNVDTVLLQFGKVDDQHFHLDFSAPFSPFQAFCIALCQFIY